MALSPSISLSTSGMLAAESFLASLAASTALIKLSREILPGAVAIFLLLAVGACGGASVGRGGSAADDDDDDAAAGAAAGVFFLILVFCPSGGDVGGGGGEDDCMTTGSGGGAGLGGGLAPFIALGLVTLGCFAALLGGGGAAFWATVFGKSTTAS